MKRGLGTVFNKSFLVFLCLAVAAGLLAWHQGGPALVKQSGQETGRLLVQVAPELVLGLLIAAFSAVLLPREKIARWLGSEAGFRGIALATLVGAIMPGGPFGSFPLVLALGQAGADIGALTAFLVSWATISVNRLLVWEVPFMGWDFGLLRLVSSIPLPLIAGMAARELASRYGFFRFKRD